MNISPEWMRSVEQTYVIKFPTQHLATFGITSVEYFVVTEPIYTAMDASKKELESVSSVPKSIINKVYDFFNSH